MGTAYDLPFVIKPGMTQDEMAEAVQRNFDALLGMGTDLNDRVASAELSMSDVVDLAEQTAEVIPAEFTSDTLTSTGDGAAPSTPGAAPVVNRQVGFNIVDMRAYTVPADWLAMEPEWAESTNGGSTWGSWNAMGNTGSLAAHGNLDYAKQYKYRFKVLDREGFESSYSPESAGVVPRKANEGGIVDISAGTVSADLLSATIVLASLIQTAATGARIELDGTTNQLRLYDAKGGITLLLNGNTGQVSVQGVFTGDLVFGSGSTLTSDTVTLVEQPAAALVPLIRQSAANGTDTLVTNMTVAWGAATNQGNCLVAAVSVSRTNGTSPGTVDTPAGWTLASGFPVSRLTETKRHRLYVFYKFNAAPQTSQNFAITGNTAYMGMNLFEATNVASFDVSATNNNNNTSGDSGTIAATTQASEFVFASVIADDGGSASWTTTGFGDGDEIFTEFGTGFTTLALASVAGDASATGAKSASATVPSDPWLGGIITLKSRISADPVQPQAGTGVIYVKDEGGVSRPYFEDDAGVVIPVGRGYTLTGHVGLTNPAASTTYYMGGAFDGLLNTTADLQRIYVPKGGTVKAIVVNFYTAGTLASAQTSATGLKVRVNGVDQATITSGDGYCKVADEPHANYALSVPLVAGDYISIKWVTPAWVTLPTSVRVHITVYIE